MKFYHVIIIAVSCLITSCSGCSKSGQKQKLAEKNLSSEPLDNERISSGRKTIVQMRKSSGGVYEVPVEVNGSMMYFIFDTGAGIISISATEARFLIKQGTLSREDVLRSEKFSDANGDVSVGMIVNLRSIKIGDQILKNVEASIVDNDVAPLLLGQSALSRFGKFTVDYEKGIIVFE